MRRTLQGILCNALEKGKRGSFNFQSGIQPWLKSKLLKLKRNLRIDNIWCHSDATNCSGFVTSLAMCANKMIQSLHLIPVKNTDQMYCAKNPQTIKYAV